METTRCSVLICFKEEQVGNPDLQEVTGGEEKAVRRSFRLFWLRTSLFVGTIVLHLTSSRLTLLCIAGTVYYKAYNTFGIEESSSDASLTD
jgi:hypothetical protein